jgi:DNA-binding XRE family transcriptional regulator
MQAGGRIGFSRRVGRLEAAAGGRYSAGMPLDVEKIRAVRTRLGLTQEAAAEAAGIGNRQKWSDIEAGRTDVRVSTLDRLAKALGVRPAELLK